MRAGRISRQRRLRAGSPELCRQRFEFFKLDYYTKHLRYPDKPITYFQGAGQALQAAEGFVQDFQNNPHTSGLMFVGPVGSGKTFLAAAICNALIDQGINLLFLVVPDFLNELRASYRHSEETDYRQLMERAQQIPLLVLDDLGAHNYTDWTRNTLYSLLNYRVNHQLPVVITTNLSFGELDEHLGENHLGYSSLPFLPTDGGKGYPAPEESGTGGLVPKVTRTHRQIILVLSD